MRVFVKLYATLRQYAPSSTGIGEAFTVELERATIRDLVDYLGFAIDQAKIIMVNGIRVTDTSHLLSPDDTVVIFPPVGGGAYNGRSSAVSSREPLSF